MVGPTYRIVIFSWLKLGPLAADESFKSQQRLVISHVANVIEFINSSLIPGYHCVMSLQCRINLTFSLNHKLQR